MYLMPHTGLSMTLNIGQYDFMPGISDIAGVVVVVHSQTRMPFPEDEGVLGHPGQLTSVGISQVSGHWNKSGMISLVLRSVNFLS